MVKVRKDKKPQANSTDLSLMVSSLVTGTIEEFSREKIIQTLEEEAGIDPRVGGKIAKIVEDTIVKSEAESLSTSTIRALVDEALLQFGYERKIKKQQILGLPTHDLHELLFNKNLENSNIAVNNPEAVNLGIAEVVLKQYALQNVFSQDVAKGHLEGAYHIHDLSYVARAYCGGHSLEYIKLQGLDLLTLSTSSSPASYARTLTGHLNTFLSSMQSYYAGALGIGFMNMFYAPYLVGMEYPEIKQEVEYLIFSGSQNAFSRGSQSLFLDYNIVTGIPNYFKNVPAVGPRGKYIEGKTYGDFEKEAQLFAKAFIEVIGKGDKNGKVFPFPKADINISKETFEDEKQRELLMLTCEAAAKNGSPYFIFNRDEGATVSQCCRLRSKITDMDMLNHPEQLRFTGFANVTINLPQAAYRAKGDVKKTIEEIEWAMDMAMKAHLQKKRFVASLMKQGLPLWQIGMPMKILNNEPYVNLEKATYIIGMVGLNECIRKLMGKELHESDEALKLGLRIIVGMSQKAKKLEKEHGLKVSLEESPAESATYRLAKIDVHNFPEAEQFIRGTKEAPFYTNSVHFNPQAEVNLIDRIVGQSKFHPLIESGAIVHAFIGEQNPSATAIYSLVEKVWKETQCSQLTISPSFTVCNDCGNVQRGWKE